VRSRPADGCPTDDVVGARLERGPDRYRGRCAIGKRRSHRRGRQPGQGHRRRRDPVDEYRIGSPGDLGTLQRRSRTVSRARYPGTHREETTGMSTEMNDGSEQLTPHVRAHVLAEALPWLTEFDDSIM